MRARAAVIMGLTAIPALVIGGAAVFTAPIDASVPEMTARLRELPADVSLLEIPERERLKGRERHFDVAATPPGIAFAILPNPRGWEGGRGVTWSAWGDAVLASDGRFYSSYGDYSEPRGSAFVCATDPDSGEIELVVEFNRLLPDRVSETQYTPGKIHASIVDGGDGYLYFSGYRSSPRTTRRENEYAGNWLLRFSLADGLTENLGVLVPDGCPATMAAYPPRGLLYGLSVPGATMFPPRTRFFAYDIAAQKPVFIGGPMSNVARAIAVTRDGRVFYDGKTETDDGVVDVLVKYDPELNEVVFTDQSIPGNGQLRAVTPENDEGLIVMMDGRGLIYLFDARSEQIVDTAWVMFPPDDGEGRHLYVTALTMDPQGRYVYGIPGAHGGAPHLGTPVIQWNIATRRPKIIAFLDDFMRREAEIFLSGTYGLAMCAEGRRLFINWNGGRAPGGVVANPRQASWQFVMAMVLDIPDTER